MTPAPSDTRDKQMVGTARFELATPCTPSKCATRLRYVPNPLPDDSVGFDLQILHQAAATGTRPIPPRGGSSEGRDQALSQKSVMSVTTGRLLPAATCSLREIRACESCEVFPWRFWYRVEQARSAVMRRVRCGGPAMRWCFMTISPLGTAVWRKASNLRRATSPMKRGSGRCVRAWTR